MSVLRLTERGLYCPAGDFFIDPWPTAAAPARCSLITHGHADHARPNSQHYIATADTVAVMRARLGSGIAASAWPTGEQRELGAARVSLHPAGHVLGSAQVRVEVDGEVWVVSGDYKRDPDPTCAAFEVVPCHTFITEATFAMPAYRWRPGAEVVGDVYRWWQQNARHGRASVLFCYAFGKAQRVLAELAAHTQTPVFLHGALTRLVALYRERGVAMLATQPVSEAGKDIDFSTALILAPPSAAGSSWMRRFGSHATGFVSGWMRIRGNRRRRGYDRGFVLSDHADWPSLVRTVNDTGAARVLVTHGRSDVLVRYLGEQGIAAQALATRFGDDEEQAAEAALANAAEPAV